MGERKATSEWRVQDTQERGLHAKSSFNIQEYKRSKAPLAAQFPQSHFPNHAKGIHNISLPNGKVVAVGNKAERKST